MHSEAAPWLQGLGTEHEGPPRLAQPFENTVFQRGTGFLIIPWSLVRIQAGPVLHRRQIRSVSAIIAAEAQTSNRVCDAPGGLSWSGSRLPRLVRELGRGGFGNTLTLIVKRYTLPL